MKRITSLYFFIFLLLLFLIPALFGAGFTRNSHINITPPSPLQSSAEISFLDTKSGKTTTINIEEYLPGVLAAEMPASYELEALKAQAVAARSYIISRINSLSDAHPKATVCTDPSHCKAWLSKKDAFDKWGENNREAYWNKLCEAVNATRSEYMICEDSVVQAFFFANSGGRTESSEDVWGGNLPYLRSVASEWDSTAPDAISEVSVPIEEFWSTLKSFNHSVVPNQGAPQISNLSLTQGGSVAEMTIGGQRFKGTEIRSLFGLKSAKFTISTNENHVLFSVIGNGHGVGMSQYGANCMAKIGKKYTEILSHYYTNIQIVKF